MEKDNEIRKLKEQIERMESQYVGLETAYYNSPSEIENKRLREVLDKVANCLDHIVEGKSDIDPTTMTHSKDGDAFHVAYINMGLAVTIQKIVMRGGRSLRTEDFAGIRNIKV